MAIKRQVLRDEVQAMILAGLTEGRYRPGSRLSIDGLARDLEVSPTPVREALVALERSGLIEYQALRGYLVAAPLTPEQIGELIDAREVLELAALERALDGDEAALCAQLEARHAEHTEAARRIREAPGPDLALVAAYFAADSAFHDVFFQRVGNPFLTAMRDALGAHAHRMRQTWTESPTEVDSAEALAEHAEIIARARAHDRAGALDALRRHLENVRDRSGGLASTAPAAAATDGDPS